MIFPMYNFLYVKETFVLNFSFLKLLLSQKHIDKQDKVLVI